MAGFHGGRNSRRRVPQDAPPRVGARLEEWLERDEPTTLGSLSDTFGEKILAAACLALMAPSALPIPSGGATHVFDVIALLFAGQLVLGRRTVWLPARWRTRQLGETSQKALRVLIRFVKWCERISRPRLGSLLTSRAGEAVLGVVIAVFIATAFLSPPFSGLDTLPALGVVLIALSILLEDAAFAVLGIVVGVGGIGLIIGLGVQATHLVKDLFR